MKNKITTLKTANNVQLFLKLFINFLPVEVKEDQEIEKP